MFNAHALIKKLLFICLNANELPKTHFSVYTKPIRLLDEIYESLEELHRKLQAEPSKENYLKIDNIKKLLKEYSQEHNLIGCQFISVYMHYESKLQQNNTISYPELLSAYGLQHFLTVAKLGYPRDIVKAFYEQTSSFPIDEWSDSEEEIKDEDLYTYPSERGRRIEDEWSDSEDGWSDSEDGWSDSEDERECVYSLHSVDLSDVENETTNEICSRFQIANIGSLDGLAKLEIIIPKQASVFQLYDDYKIQYPYLASRLKASYNTLDRIWKDCKKIEYNLSGISRFQIELFIKIVNIFHKIKQDLLDIDEYNFLIEDLEELLKLIPEPTDQDDFPKNHLSARKTSSKRNMLVFFKSTRGDELPKIKKPPTSPATPTGP